MTAIRHILARVRALFTGAGDDRDFADELQAHLDLATDDNIRRGLDPIEARRQAALRLGAASSLHVRHRDTRGFPALDSLLQDLRFALRLIVKERWFSAAAIAAIALGIGANTVGFTIVNAAFLRGFNFDRADEIHSISWRGAGSRRQPASIPDLEDFRAASSFASIGASARGAINISDDHAAPEQTQGARITANLFDVLHQPTLLGRALLSGDEMPGAEPVVVIGYRLWERRFDRDPAVVGRTLRINGSPATIVGVMPEGMEFPEESELWVPLIPTQAQRTRTYRWLSLFGRRAAGVSPEQAASEMDTIAQRILDGAPDDSRRVAGVRVETLIERFLNGQAPRVFLTIMGAVIFVLLIACANVANLLLSRAAYRSREVAVRYALGATRWRVIRQLLIESVMLSALGGAVGLILASVGTRLFDDAIRATGAPYWLRFTIDHRVLASVVLTCVGTGVLFGMAPALQVSRANPHDAIKEGARGAAGSRRAGRLGGIMVVGELALTIVLLCGAGLMMRSFFALYAAPPGFSLDGLSRMRLQLPPSNYPTADARKRFYDRLLPIVGAVPGVQDVAVTTAAPPRAQESWRVIIAGGPDVADDRRPFVSTVAVSPEYFSTLEVPIQRGRGIELLDSAPGAANVVINQMMADQFFPGTDPIGQQLRFVPRLDEPDAPPQPWRTIVGIVPTILQGDESDAFRDPVVYWPFLAAPDRTASLLVRSSLPAVKVMAEVRRAVQSIDPDQPVFAIETAEQVMSGERGIYRVLTALFGLLAAIGLTLSAVGIYGVIAYAVTQRTQEIGIRVAIGAGRWDVSWLFLRKGLLQLGLAFVIGLPAALGLAALAQFRFAGVEPNDPITIAGITVVVSVVALIACVLPARKATRIDPVIALRAD